MVYNVPAGSQLGGYNPLKAKAYDVYQQGRNFIGNAASAAGRYVENPVSGVKAATGLGAKVMSNPLIGGIARVAGKLAVPVTAAGAAINLGGRLLSGQDPARAAVATAGDTANFVAFGLGGENAGDRLANTVLGERPQDTLTRATQDYNKAMAAGDTGGAAKAAQEANDANGKIMGRPGGGSPQAGMPGESSGAFEVQNKMYSDMYDPRNPQTNNFFQDQSFKNSQRELDAGETRNDRLQRKALERSYVADNYKTNQGMASGALSSYLDLNRNNANTIMQAANIRY